MEHYPTEVWAYIFAFACSDGGKTGRRLASVSRYVRAASDPVRMRSVALYSVEQICSFADALKDMPDRVARTIRVLDVSVDMAPASSPLDDPHESFDIAHALEYPGRSTWPKSSSPSSSHNFSPSSFDMDAYISSIRTRARTADDALRFILSKLAPSLQSLSLWLNPEYERLFAFLPKQIKFPELMYFAFRGECMPAITPLTSPVAGASGTTSPGHDVQCPALRDVTVVWDQFPVDISQLLLALSPKIASIRIICRARQDAQTLLPSNLASPSLQ
ncbi:hypothetical protein HGRIS_011246 [Hohenbuehelia grisea]|uniref:Uncharacterized protein n=1 Tax=Hohenbuehelia grisea TaxID=104357 RepID=A0ABR3JWN5_9AGAR